MTLFSREVIMRMLGLVVIVTCLSAGAVGAGDDDVLNTNSKAFRVPLVLDLKIQAHLKEVRVHLSVDKGKTWKLFKTIAPDATGFHFDAPDDGAYWFALQFLDKDGKLAPEDSKLAVGLKVNVNTKGGAGKDKIDPAVLRAWEEKEAHYKKVIRDYELQVADLKGIIRDLSDRLDAAGKGTDKVKLPLPAADDDKALTGVWQAVEFVTNGTPAREEIVKDIKMAFKEGRMVLVGPGSIGTREFTYKLDPKPTPRRINIVPIEGDFKGTMVPAIYDLRGDELRLCMPNKETKTAPAAFVAPEGGNLALFILRRLK